jgi:drug/metabolite transporter (DMT)-like permease
MFRFGIGEAAATVTGFSWAISCLIHAEAARRLGTASMLITRLPLALASLFVLAWAGGELHAYPLRAVLIMIASGAIGVASCDWCFYMAIPRIGIRAALVCQCTYACMTALLGVIFLGERLGLQGAAGIVIATAGVIMVVAAERDTQTLVRADSAGRRIGLILALASAASLALSLILSKEAMRNGLPPVTGGLIRTSAAMSAIWMFNLRAHNIGRAFADLRRQPRIIILLMCGCVFGTVGGMVLSMISLVHTASGIASTLMGLQAVFLAFLTWAMEHRRPAAGTMIGSAVACLGAAILLLR